MKSRVLEVSYRPIKKIGRQLRDSFVICPKNNNPHELSISFCVKCNYLDKINFDTVRCNYDGVTCDPKGTETGRFKNANINVESISRVR